MKASAAQRETLAALVGRVLASWTGYQLALRNQAAGQNTGTYNEMLHQELTALLADSAELDKFDLEDWLGDAFNDAFDLLLEDGSVEQMSALLADARRLVLADRAAEAARLLEALPDAAAVQSLAAQSKTVEADEEDGSDSSDEDVEQESDAAAKPSRAPRTETDDDGWTTILARK